MLNANVQTHQRCGAPQRVRHGQFVPFSGANSITKAVIRSHVDLLPASAASLAPQPVFAPKQHSSSICSRLAASNSSSASADSVTLPDGSVSVVLLAGGVGKRMGAAIPKQYLELKDQPIATYSLATFASMPQVGEIVIVCDPSWRYIFEERLTQLSSSSNGRKLPAIHWALPGAERQDSVCNGLQQVRWL